MGAGPPEEDAQGHRVPGRRAEEGGEMYRGAGLEESVATAAQRLGHVLTLLLFLHRYQKMISSCSVEPPVETS